MVSSGGTCDEAESKAGTMVSPAVGLGGGGKVDGVFAGREAAAAFPLGRWTSGLAAPSLGAPETAGGAVPTVVATKIHASRSTASSLAASFTSSLGAAARQASTRGYTRGVTKGVQNPGDASAASNAESTAATAPVRYTGSQHLGPARTSPYPVSRLAPVHNLVDLAQEIERADELVSTSTNAKLEEIAIQIRSLQARAREVVEEARVDVALHHARCSFKKRIGHPYHLYRRASGEHYFSMISPSEWGDSPHEFVGTYCMQPDRRWVAVDPERPKPSLDEARVRQG